MRSRRGTSRIPPGRRAWLAWTLWGCGLAVICPTILAAPERPVAERALTFFVTLPRGDVAAALRSRRPSPISLDDRNRALTSLPRKGALRPSDDEIGRASCRERVSKQV